MPRGSHGAELLVGTAVSTGMAPRRRPDHRHQFHGFPNPTRACQSNPVDCKKPDRMFSKRPGFSDYR